MWPIATYIAWSVSVSVCLSVFLENPSAGAYHLAAIGAIPCLDQIQKVCLLVLLITAIYTSL